MELGFKFFFGVGGLLNPLVIDAFFFRGTAGLKALLSPGVVKGRGDSFLCG